MHGADHRASAVMAFPAEPQWQEKIGSPRFDETRSNIAAEWRGVTTRQAEEKWVRIALFASTPTGKLPFQSLSSAP